MPELPEVETIRNDLKRKISGLRIKRVKVDNERMVGGSADKFCQSLRGKIIKDISRVGKLLILSISSGKYLLIHLKMTGQLVYRKKGNITAGGHSLGGQKTIDRVGGALPNKYSHVIFYFEDGSELFFNDMRQFGYLKIVDSEELEEIKKNYGIEPLARNFRLSDFKKIFSRKKINAKALLLNQKLVAGIGNIYADEILFDANINPRMAAGKLLIKEIEAIFKSAQRIIKKAIKHRGTTFSDYRDTSGEKGNFSRFLRVYGREGEECVKCGRIIKKIKLGGRGTRFCENCQK